MLSNLNVTTSNPISTGLILIDPMTMQRPLTRNATDTSQPAAHTILENDLFAGNPFAIASPFCNPDI